MPLTLELVVVNCVNYVGFEVLKEKIPCPCRESNPGRPARSIASIPTELPRLIMLKVYEVKAAVTVIIKVSSLKRGFINCLFGYF
jgi:hypothetical protein